MDKLTKKVSKEVRDIERELHDRNKVVRTAVNPQRKYAG